MYSGRWAKGAYEYKQAAEMGKCPCHLNAIYFKLHKYQVKDKECNGKMDGAKNGDKGVRCQQDGRSKWIIVKIEGAADTRT